MKLLSALNCENEVHLIVGASNLAYIRIMSSLQAAAEVVFIADGAKETISAALTGLIEEGKIRWVNHNFEISDLQTYGKIGRDKAADRVFVTLPISQADLKKQIYDECRSLRIPINTADSPELSSFTLLSSYSSGDFQFGVTTSGKGCRLAARIKREISNVLPANIGDICDRIGELRKRIQEEDERELKRAKFEAEIGEHEEDAINTSKLNSFVSEFNMTQEQKKLQRTRWLSQIVEYFPLEKLATVSVDDLSNAYHKQQLESVDPEVVSKKGAISLVGSGPGAISLLTIGALSEIHSADLILADKLVPQQVLDVIPRSTETFIARKFPGNAEKAQEELLTLGLEALQQGKKVVRLKQGDPYIFGRGGEEYIFFKKHGFEPVVLPGITSALAAPVMTNIPATHREVADQVLICTGTGRRGVLPNLPDFNKSRTTVFLMSLHRVIDLIPALIEKGWDPKVPAAIIERASCPDQRVVRTTLDQVANAVEAVGSRPPGLLVTGMACEVLEKLSAEERWRVEEGCHLGGVDTLGDVLSNLKEQH